MARLVNGLNGPIEGKAGDVIGSSRNGVYYIKGPYKKRTTRITEKEKGNRSKFSDAQMWLKPLLPFVREGFKGYSRKSYGFIAAKSHLMLNAFVGEQPEISIDPSLAMVSYGELSLSANIAVEQVEGNMLKFTWDPSYIEGTDPNDQVMLLAYDIDDKDPWYTITGQFRKTGFDLLPVSKTAGKTYHIYFAFTAADRSQQSNSIYLGEVNF